MGIIKSLSLAGLLALAPLLLVLSGASGDPVASEATRGGLDDPFDPTVYMLDHGNVIYPGQSERFYIGIYGTYNGSGYQGASSPGNETTVKDARMRFIEVLDNDGTPTDNDPLIWEVGTFYNNGGDGYEIDRYNTVYFYSDASNSYMRYSIKTTDVRPGDYILRFRITYRYMTNWDGADNYEWNQASFYIEYEMEVRSYIGADGYPDYRMLAFEEDMGIDPLYSGAEHKLFGLRNTYSLSGILTDISGTISFPGNPISVDVSTITSENMPPHFVWRINVPKDTEAGTYGLTIAFSYTRNGEQIVEAPSSHGFELEYTPLLMPPDHNDLESPYATFNRASLPNTLEVPLTNAGNVDLKDVRVRLDMENARYVENGRVWFDENANGNDVVEDQEIMIDLLEVGDTETATFSMVNFLPHLPPGLYKIPMDYLAKYNDQGGTGNAPGEKLSGYWDEMGYYQHRNILRDTVYPEDTSDYHIPYILIRIVDDNGPMFSGYIDSGYNQYPGTVNAYMRLYVENHEMYQFKNMVYSIHVDGDSPFAYPYSSGKEEMNTTTLPSIYRSGIGESSSSYTANDRFYFYAKIKSDALPGLNYFQVDVSGFDEFGQPFETSFMGYVSIRAQQPRFEDVNISVGEIMDDRSVEVTVTIQNMGLGGASNLSCYFRSNYGGYISNDPAMFIGDVGPGDQFIFIFHYRPEGERRYFSSNYNGRIYFAYYDDIGDHDEMFSGDSLYIRFDIYDKVADLMIIEVDAPLVDRNNEFDVDITVMNVGGSAASDISLLLPYSASYFDVENPQQELEDLGPGETAVISFTMRAGPEISDGSTYSFSVRFAFTDIMGRSRTFSDADSESFSIRTKDRIIPSEQTQVVKDDGQLVSEGAGNIILGILIIVAVILFVRLTQGRPKLEIKNYQESAKEKKDKKVETENNGSNVEVVVEDEEEEEEEDIEEEDEGMW